ncbi:helix-turn-helix domain-containing protein [Prauserella muralis]|uniref:Uncharacterized protein n=1 Tax=Prauserella muralis TaxID=588067 RepID=A0A2V4AG20_9PSEU|nr:helix-turn-helix domain-containing protein [Prauserella muralis]PXY18898.1 hypothetical protein BAY60_29095 [Prauserella muralis]TWE28767.1 AraC family transcriptional regulator [Prauserella muralis]
MTAVLAPEDHRPLDVDAFAWTVSQAFVPLETADARAGFRGRVHGGSVGPLHVCEVAADAHTVQRTPRTIRVFDPGYLKVGLQLHGRGLVMQDDRLASLGPGEFALYDTTRPYRLRFDEPYRVLVLMLPRQLLRLSDSDLARITAQPLGGHSGLGAVAVPLLRQLAAGFEEYERAVTTHLAEAAVELLAAVFVAQVDDSRSSRPSTKHWVLRARIAAFVEANLPDPGLDVPSIAAAHHISVRQLQKIFESEQTTASAWIRERRLERCRRDLADPRLAHLPVAAIGARSGLRDSAHFIRTFKTRYGVTPGAFRRERQVGA